jgi:Domain of unknown function (DUF4157)
VGREFSRRPDTTAPARVAASALWQGQAPEDEQARQAPVAADVAAWEVGGTPDPEAQAAALVETSGGRLARTGGLLLQLQRDFGNRHVQQVVQHALRAGRPTPPTGSGLTLGPAEDRYEQQADQVARRLAGGAPSRQAAGDAAAGYVSPAPAMQDEHGGVDGRVRQAIQGARGGGQPLPEWVRDRVEPVVGADLGGVRLHTDARADQLARALGARAFTTGAEVFLRRGEYRPDSTAGRRLLAHELAHVAQQAGGTIDADGVSNVSPGVVGAGVIQRIRIDEKETEDRLQKKELVNRIERMTVSELEDMRTRIVQAVNDSKKPATDSVNDLLGAIAIQLTLMKVKERREARAKPGEVQGAPAKPREVQGAPAKPGEVPDSKEMQESSPLLTEVSSPPQTLAEGQNLPAIKQGASVELESSEGKSGSAKSPPPQPKSRMTSKGEIREIPESRSSEDEPPVVAQGKMLRDEAQRLSDSASKLASSPGGGLEAINTWIQAAAACRNDIGIFLEKHEAWRDDFSDRRKTSPATRIQYRERLASPLEGQAVKLRDSFSEINMRLVVERQRFEEVKKRSELEQEAKRQEEMIAQRYGPMLARRQNEVTDGQKLVGQYVFETEFKLDKGPATWGGYATTVPKLLAEWVFTKAITEAAQHADPWVKAVLDYLHGLPKSHAEAVGNVLPGPWLELSSGSSAGKSNDNWIGVSIEPKGKPDLLEFLTGEDDATREARNALVTETASTFIHEAAHVQQRQIYGNASFPWHPRPEEKRLGATTLTAAGSLGVPIEKSTEDVQEAYKEFTEGGSDKQLRFDPKWRDISGTLERYADWVEEEVEVGGVRTKVKTVKGKDERASELVSHLMELLYAWKYPQDFDKVFPKCAELLNRVIVREGLHAASRQKATQSVH